MGPWTATGGSGTMACMPTWTIKNEPVTGTGVDEVMREYFTEMGRRVLGGSATEAELRAVLAEDPHQDLSPPDGEFLVARSGEGEFLGCAGLRLLRGDPETAELKRMYVRPAGRGRGWAGAFFSPSRNLPRGWVLPGSCARPTPNSRRHGLCTQGTVTRRPRRTKAMARRITGTPRFSAKSCPVNDLQ